jgi:hypothetical protein
MVIIEREGKYFLQISNGELELSEKQAKARLEKGTATLKKSSVYAPVADIPGQFQPSEISSEPGPVITEPKSFPAEDQVIMPITQYDPEPATAEGPGDIVSEEADTPLPIDAAPKPAVEPPLASREPANPLWEITEEDPVPVKTASVAKPVSKIPAEAQAFILSDEYYDNIIREFEKVYVANGRKEETALELLDHCQKSIDHLKLERAQPGADLAVLDYQRLCWLRIIIFLQALTGVAAPKHPDVLAEKEKVESDRSLIKQLLVIQLLQETGAFPYADALKSITHDSIVGLIARILNKEKGLVKTFMQRSGDILLRRNASPANAAKRLKLLTEIEKYFSELPYNHVIIRLKSLREFYKNLQEK